jgi:hypothetical protein
MDAGGGSGTSGSNAQSLVLPDDSGGAVVISRDILVAPTKSPRSSKTSTPRAAFSSGIGPRQCSVSGPNLTELSAPKDLADSHTC